MALKPRVHNALYRGQVKCKTHSAICFATAGLKRAGETTLDHLIILAVCVGIAGTLYWAFRPQGHYAPRRSALSEQNNYAKDETFRAALRYGREVEVAGESYDNPDGIARRDVIATLKVGDMLQFVREPENKFDPNAIVVQSFQGVIGYVCSGDAAEIAPWMDRGEKVAAYVSSIAGGPERGKRDYGVWLRALSLAQLPGIIAEQEANQLARKTAKARRLAEAKENGWEPVKKAKK